MRAVSCAWRRVGSLKVGSFKVGETRGAQERRQRRHLEQRVLARVHRHLRLVVVGAARAAAEGRRAVAELGELGRTVGPKVLRDGVVSRELGQVRGHLHAHKRECAGWYVWAVSCVASRELSSGERCGARQTKAHLLEVVLKLREDDRLGRAAPPLLPPPLAPRVAHHLEDVFGGAAADARGEGDLALLLHSSPHGAPYGPPDRLGQREVRLRVTDHQRLEQIDQLGGGAVGGARHRTRDVASPPLGTARRRHPIPRLPQEAQQPLELNERPAGAHHRFPHRRSARHDPPTLRRQSGDHLVGCGLRRGLILGAQLVAFVDDEPQPPRAHQRRVAAVVVVEPFAGVLARAPLEGRDHDGERREIVLVGQRRVVPV